MNNEVLQFFGLAKHFYQASFMETELIKQQIQNIKSAVWHGENHCINWYGRSWQNHAFMENTTAAN